MTKDNIVDFKPKKDVVVTNNAMGSSFEDMMNELQEEYGEGINMVTVLEMPENDFEMDVILLNDAFGCKREMTEESIMLRLSLLEEEFMETKVALRDAIVEYKTLGYVSTETNKEILDGLVDIMVIAAGTADIFNYDLTGAWTEIMRSNMSKVQEDGTVLRREDGKVLKPDGYTPPDLGDFVCRESIYD